MPVDAFSRRRANYCHPYVYPTLCLEWPSWIRPVVFATPSDDQVSLKAGIHPSQGSATVLLSKLRCRSKQVPAMAGLDTRPCKQSVIAGCPRAWHLLRSIPVLIPRHFYRCEAKMVCQIVDYFRVPLRRSLVDISFQTGALTTWSESSECAEYVVCLDLADHREPRFSGLPVTGIFAIRTR